MWRGQHAKILSRYLQLRRTMATGVFTSKLELPHSFQAGQKSFVLKECPPNRYDEIIKVFQDSASSADGVGLDEFPTHESLMQKITSSQLVIIGEEKETNQLALVYLFYPTPISRSENPVNHSGYLIITKNFRKIGLGVVMYVLAGSLGVTRFGYHGILGRTGTTSKSIVGLMNGPTVFLGVIPRSILVANKGMTDDLVVYSNYSLHEQKSQEETPPLPALQTSNLTPYDEVSFAPVTMSLPAGTFTLRPSASRDVELVEHLIREAAESGGGFAIDEFRPNGQFNRAFFQRCHLAVLCDSNESFIGAALFGLSSLVRTTTLQTSHIYIVIDKAYRYKGIGQTMLKEMLKVIRSVGYERIITDIYSYNHSALHICHKLKFQVTASIPECGYLKNHGNCASYVLANIASYNLFSEQVKLPSSI